MYVRSVLLKLLLFVVFLTVLAEENKLLSNDSLAKRQEKQ
jgi:hypothetical protein